MPEWIQITPAGYVVANDSRQFDFADLPSIAAATKLPLLLDVDHQSERPEGSSAASGWITELAISEGIERAPGIWARVEFTPRGADLVSTKTYRFLSPTFFVNKKKQVTSLVSVALVNNPALSMTALDYQRYAARFQLPNEVSVTDTDQHVVALCAALQVSPQDDADTIELAAKSATELRETCTRLTAEVESTKAEASKLKTELETVTTRANEAEKQLAAQRQASFVAEVERCLDEACTASQITPAQKDAFKVFCAKSPENFDIFKSTVLPVMPKKLDQKVQLAASQPKTIPDHLRIPGYTEQQIQDAYELARRQQAKGK